MDNDPAEQIQASSNLTLDPQIQASSKKVRGLNKATIRMIEAMKEIAAETKPITGRGIGYKLFSAGLIDSMSKGSMNTVYYALKLARERGDIPWDWIIDETREPEIVPSWENSPRTGGRFLLPPRSLADAASSGRGVVRERHHSGSDLAGVIRAGCNPASDARVHISNLCLEHIQ